MPSARGVTAGKAFVMIEAVDKTGKVLQKVSSRLQAFAGRIKQIGMGMLALGAALTIPLVSSVKAASEFGDEILALQTALEITDKSMQDVEKTVRKLGASTSFTAQQVAAAGTELARGGFNKKEVQDSLKAVLDLARAGRLELPLAAKTMIQSIRVFNLSSEEAGTVADKFALAAKRGTTNIEELAQALSFCGGTAAELGFSLDDTLSILSVVSRKMLTATKGGTSLNQMFTRLATESDKLEEIGIKPFDDDGKAKNGLKILIELAAVLRGMTQQEKIQTASDIFNVRGMRQALAVANSIEGIIDLNKEMSGSFGLASRDAAKMDSGIGGTIRRIMSAFDELKISIGDAFEKPIKAGEKVVVGFLNFLSDFAKENEAVFVQIGHAIALMIGSGAGLLVLSGVVALLGGIASGISAFVAAIPTIGSIGAGGFALLAGLVTGVVAGFGFLVSATTAFALAFKRFWRDVKDDVISFGEKFRESWAAVLLFLKRNLIDMVRLLSAEFNHLRGPFTTFIKKLTQNLKQLIPLFEHGIADGVLLLTVYLKAMIIVGTDLTVVFTLLAAELTDVLIPAVATLSNFGGPLQTLASTLLSIAGLLNATSGGPSLIDELKRELDLKTKLANLEKARAERQAEIDRLAKENEVTLNEDGSIPRREDGSIIFDRDREAEKIAGIEGGELTEDRKKELREKLKAKAEQIARETALAKLARDEETAADVEALEERRQAQRDLNKLRLDHAREVDPVRKKELAKRIADEEKSIVRQDAQDKRNSQRGAIEELERKKRAAEAQKELKEIENELGEKAPTIPGAGGGKLTPGEIDGSGKKVNPELYRHLARTESRISAVKELRNRATGRTSSNIGAAFEKGSMAAAQQIIKTKFEQTQIKLLASIDEQLKRLEDIERKTLKKIDEASGLAGVP